MGNVAVDMALSKAVARQLALNLLYYYVRMVIEYCGHAWYGAHITVCMALLVCVLCQ